MITRIIQSLFLVLVLFLTFPLKAHASEYFSTSYYVTYDVLATGETSATIDVTLTNKTSDYYASSYKVQVGFSEIANVRATDPQGELNPTITKTAEGNIIEAEFNERVVGLDNSLTYTISFTTPDIAKSYGAIWEINIPGISDPSAFDEFVVDVNVPESFGTPTYIKPFFDTEDTVFTKEQLGTSGISIAYGTEQIYTFDLTYKLQNKNLFPVKTEIALPPTTNYQEVYISSIEPRPENVVVDQDGNWLASFTLDPATKQDVSVQGHALVKLTPEKEPLSQEELSMYLSEDTYWEVSNPKIVELAKKLKTPRAIYDYVVETLTYDFSRVEQGLPRLGGLATLENNQSAVCLEFTDLFITLARAAGIPAREVDGYAHTENARQRPASLVKDILHAWPEYYDREKQTWIMVDPTCGNTTGGVDYFDTFDFDHLTFVIKGVDSEYPIPAGGYTYADDQSSNIHISFSPEFQKPESRLAFQTATAQMYYSELPIQAELIVRNEGAGISNLSEAAIQSDSLTPVSQSVRIPKIPPFGHVVLPLTFEKQPLLTDDDFDFTVQVAGMSTSHTLRVSPVIYSWYVIALGGVFIGILALVIFVIVRKSRRVSILE